MRRRVGLAVAVVLVAVVAVVAVDLARRPTTPGPVSSAAARTAAGNACADATDFESLILRNAPVDEVKAVLRRAERQADTAARGDPRWYALSGGLKSIDIALDANDGRAARTGIDVVRTECRHVTG